MPKTRELTIMCDEVTIKNNYTHGVKVILDEPDINGLLSELDIDKIYEYVRSETSNNPSMVFDDEYLEKWAEENGYTKE